jgi:hypothetical protein
MSDTGEVAVEAEALDDEGHTNESACLNCGAVLVGEHCHACGQHAHVHRTLGAFFHDLAHGALHFEGKVWRTLPLLFLKPGKLTREYIDGRRASYVSPIALFLFAVFAMFATLQVSHLIDPEPVEAEIARTTDAAGTVAIDSDGPGGTGITINKSGVEWLDKAVAQASDNPALLLYKLKANSYKFSWLLIPLSVPFVALLFLWRRRFGLYDHAVFVTYSLCFVSLFYVGLWMLGWIGVPSNARFVAGMLVPPVHIYKQLRGTYELRRHSALWRLAALLVFIPMILFLFFVGLMMIGMLG